MGSWGPKPTTISQDPQQSYEDATWGYCKEHKILQKYTRKTANGFRFTNELHFSISFVPDKDLGAQA